MINEEKFVNITAKEVKTLEVKLLEKYLDDYLKQRMILGNSIATINNQKSYVNTFIYFVLNNNYKFITQETIHEYIKSLDKKANATIDKYLKSLKLFFRYLFEQNQGSSNYEFFIPKTKYLTKSKTPLFWNNEDIEKLLASIDTNTIIGKRDYAMLLLIIKLGLRAIDVINLELDNIDWKNNQIKFFQHKTTEYQCLPLLSDVGNAIIDYLLNSRNNNVGVRKLFLDNDKPINSSRKLTLVLYRYEKKANIVVNKSQKNGVHSLRNTLACNLLSNETPIGTISQVLGHVNPNTTMIYLKIDINRLRNCILDWREL